MNPSDLPSETLFEGAIQCRSPAERAAYLDRVCAGQPELRSKLETLLGAHDRAGEFLEPAGDLRPIIQVELPPDEPAGTMIGRYKFLQKIGEGGMGVVYMAEQTEPVVRKVALKIIKLGMDTKAVVARFEAERQALALMDHPNIARVLDAGATDAGRPYFVMELVHGVPITEYCDRNKLSTKERLELFIPVCQAIQHAHQKGIIHRDIKPSNVMVTLHDGVPVPKVIDFGVAKATNQRLTERTLFTNYAQMIGTPAYMSPEQAEMSGLDIDTRSDIYSLGVLLYELLTGTTPFNAKELLSKGYAEIQRIIAQEEPPKPSTRMSTMQNEERTVMASNRSMDASALRKAFQGDLDWIVMKCLEKDRTRRYETSNGLAADLRRHLNNELITARAPTTGYLLRKLIKRNRVAFVAASAVVGALLIGMVATTWQVILARRAEQRARAAEHQALATVEELRGTAPAFAEQARALVAQSRFDEAIAKLDYAVQLRPDVADYLVMKANLLQCQLKLTEAVPVYRTALKVRPDDPQARANLKLAEELITAQSAHQGRLSTQELARFLSAMQAEQRSAAELLPVSQALGKEKEVQVAYWMERLKDLPIPADKPLEQRLGLNENGRLDLDLSGTLISDLSPLRGMPLGRLYLNQCGAVTDLGPLRGSPLRKLQANGTQVRDLSPLSEVPNLASLHLENTPISDLSPLKNLKLQALHLMGCEQIRDLSPLTGMPLSNLGLRRTRVTTLAPLRGLPLRLLDLTQVPATDYEELVGAPLEMLLLQEIKVEDLSFLEGMPLKRLSLWGSPQVRNFAVLTRLKQIELIHLPGDIANRAEPELLAIDALENHPTLKQIGNESDGKLFMETQVPPKEQFWRKWKTMRHLQNGRYDEARALAEAEVEEWRRQGPPGQRQLESATRRLAKCEAYSGNFTEAARLLRAIVDADIQRIGALGSPDDEMLDWTELAATLLAAGDQEGYQKLCVEMLPRFPNRPGAIREDVAKVWLFGRNSGIPDRVIGEYVQAAKNGEPNWYYRTAGLHEYRAGRFEEAERLLREPIQWHVSVGCRDILLAVIEHQRGNGEAARRLMKQVEASGVAQWPPLRAETYPIWADFLFLHLLFNEATHILDGTAAAPARVP